MLTGERFFSFTEDWMCSWGSFAVSNDSISPLPRHPAAPESKPMGQKHTALSSDVDLSGKCNGVFPTSVEPRDFQRLKTVQLANNGLAAIPLSVSTQLTEKPPLLETLTSLDLSKNKLKAVPEELILLVNLVSLRLDQNELAGLPLKFSLLFKLEKVNVSANAIRYLPPNMGNLKNLKELRVDDNQLTYLPADLGSIKTLKKLSFDGNPLPDDLLDFFFLSDTKNTLEFISKMQMPPDYEKMNQKFRRAIAESGQAEVPKSDPAKGERFEIFKVMMEDKNHMAAFSRHLDKEHAGENMKFHLAVEAFKSKYNSPTEITTSECIGDAEKIYDAFVRDDAPDPINLPEQVKKKVDALYKDTYRYPAGINQFIFNECQNAIIQLMFTDSLKRFQDTEEGKAVWTHAEKRFRRRNK